MTVLVERLPIVPKLNLNLVKMSHGWEKTSQKSPQHGDVVPVWDGKTKSICYAHWYHKNSERFCTVVQTKDLHDDHYAGEIISPTHWLEIFPPDEEIKREESPIMIETTLSMWIRENLSNQIEKPNYTPLPSSLGSQSF